MSMPTTQPTPKVARISITKAVEAVLELSVRKATVYQHPRLTVVATRRHRPRKNARFVEILLTIGQPNFASRKFIKDCLKAGEKFPVRKIQLEWLKK
jgi:hypothetical protein